MPPPDRRDDAPAVRLVLVHSPIVGPDTWGPVAEVLRSRACHVLVPRLRDDGAPPWWAAHVHAVTESVGDPDPAGSPLVLVLHSGAGQLADLLVARLEDLGHTVEAVVFADAGLPTPGISRLAQLHAETPAHADHLADLLRAGERWPDWTDAQLRPLVPDGARRRRLLDGLRPKPATYWTEPIPQVEVPAHQRAVLLLSSSYGATARAADDGNWPLIDLRADNHFLPLVDETRVADALLRLIDRLLDRPDGGPARLVR